MGKRSGYVEDRDLDPLSKAERQHELTVWRDRAQRAKYAMMRKSADRRLHLIEKFLADAK